MNYTFIEINKEKLPIKFGFNALRKYSSKTNTSLQDLDKLGVDMTLDGALNLIYCGIEDGHRAAKQEFKLTIDDLADLIDNDLDANNSGGVKEAAHYGIAHWHQYNNQSETALAMYNYLVKNGIWTGFGYIAAEAELSRIQ